MKRITIFSILILLLSGPLSAKSEWGQLGHRVTGQIAQKYLTPKAARKIKAILSGQSLALVSTYADEIKSDPRYKELGSWHYVDYPFGTFYENSPKNEKGDIIVAINKCISILKDKNAKKEDQIFYLKLLVHFMGDLHQPLHVGLAEDKGGNDFQVQWFNKGTNLHTVWDTTMLEDYGMSYSELAKNADELSIEQLNLIKHGTIMDWANETRTLTEDIYNNTKIGEKLSYGYSYRYVNVARQQLQKAGIRLAEVLNGIFS